MPAKIHILQEDPSLQDGKHYFKFNDSHVKYAVPAPLLDNSSDIASITIQGTPTGFAVVMTLSSSGISAVQTARSAAAAGGNLPVLLIWGGEVHLDYPIDDFLNPLITVATYGTYAEALALVRALN